MNIQGNQQRGKRNYDKRVFTMKLRIGDWVPTGNNASCLNHGITNIVLHKRPILYYTKDRNRCNCRPHSFPRKQVYPSAHV